MGAPYEMEGEGAMARMDAPANPVAEGTVARLYNPSFAGEMPERPKGAPC